MRPLERQRPDTPDGWKRFLAFGCAHLPLIDRDAEDWLVERIKEFKPDCLVNLGDLHEAAFASRWPDEYEFTAEDEFRAVNRFLKRIRTAAGDSTELVFIRGNHDENILAINRLNRKIRSRCDWRIRQEDDKGRWLNEELMTYWNTKTQYVNDRNRGVWRLGQVVFKHGFQANVTSGKTEAVRFANEFGLVVGAHTHRPEDVTQAMLTSRVPLRYWYANTGCLRNMDADYVTRLDHDRWGHGIVLGAANPQAGLSKTPRTSCHWWANTEVLKMFTDWSCGAISR